MAKKKKNASTSRYTPAYKVYDNRTNAQRIREFSTALLLCLICAGIAWVLMAIIATAVTKEVAWAYWPITIVYYSTAWASIIGWPIWLVIEIAAIIVSVGENKRQAREL